MLFCVAGVVLCDIPTCLIPCRMCQNWKSLARNARFAAPTCLVSSFWFSFGVAVSMGEAAKLQSRLEFLHCLSSGVAVSMGKAAKPRLFCCTHVAVSMGEAAQLQSRLEFLLVLWRRRVYGGSCKASLVLMRSRRCVYGGSCKTSL